MASIDANQARPGTKLMLNDELYTVVERAHHKPGKGGALVRFKLKGIVSGKVIDHTVRAGARLEKADVTTRSMEFLYKDGENFVFMDSETYEQHMLDSNLIGFGAKFLKENAEAQVTMYEEAAIGVALPQKMDFEIVDTIENPAMGNTATNTTKAATIETGFEIQVPLFIKIGDHVRILTEDGSYLERVNL